MFRGVLWDVQEEEKQARASGPHCASGEAALGQAGLLVKVRWLPVWVATRSVCMLRSELMSLLETF